MFCPGHSPRLAGTLLACALCVAATAPAFGSGPDGDPAAQAEQKDPVADFPKTLGLPPYPGSNYIPMDGELSTGQVPLDAIIFTTTDPVDRVMAFYEQNLASRKIRSTKHYFGPQAGYVGFFHVETGTMRLANVRATPRGTMIILSAMNPMPLLAKQMQVPEDLPSLPSAINVVTTESKQGQSRNRTVHFDAWGRPAEVTGKMREAALGQGWRVSDKGNGLLDDALTLKRGHEICIIRVTEASDTKEDQPSSTVTMVVIEENSPEGSKGK